MTASSYNDMMTTIEIQQLSLSAAAREMSAYQLGNPMGLTHAEYSAITDRYFAAEAEWNRTRPDAYGRPGR